MWTPSIRTNSCRSNSLLEVQLLWTRKGAHHVHWDCERNEKKWARRKERSWVRVGRGKGDGVVCVCVCVCGRGGGISSLKSRRGFENTPAVSAAAPRTVDRWNGSPNGRCSFMSVTGGSRDYFSNRLWMRPTYPSTHSHTHTHTHMRTHTCVHQSRNGWASKMQSN